MRNNSTMKNSILKDYGLHPPMNPAPAASAQSQPVKGKDGKMYIKKGNFMVPVGG